MVTSHQDGLTAQSLAGAQRGIAERRKLKVKVKIWNRKLKTEFVNQF